MAWLKWKSYNIWAVAGTSITAGSTSKGFEGLNDQAGDPID